VIFFTVILRSAIMILLMKQFFTSVRVITAGYLPPLR